MAETETEIPFDDLLLQTRQDQGRSKMAVDVDDIFRATLETLDSSFAEFDDATVRMDLEGFLPNSYFLYVTKSVFTRMQVGLLGLLSGGLLQPLHSDISGRLMPGFCPYVEHTEGWIGLLFSRPA